MFKKEKMEVEERKKLLVSLPPFETHLEEEDEFTKFWSFYQILQSGKNQMETEETPLDNIKQYTHLPSHGIPGFQQKQEELLGLTILFDNPSEC